MISLSYDSNFSKHFSAMNDGDAILALVDCCKYFIIFNNVEMKKKRKKQEAV